MFNIPVISPFAGHLHLNHEQYKQFMDIGFVRFAEPPESFHFATIPSDIAEQSMRVVTFERIKCGDKWAAKADSAPYRLRTFVREGESKAFQDEMAEIVNGLKALYQPKGQQP